MINVWYRVTYFYAHRLAGIDLSSHPGILSLIPATFSVLPGLLFCLSVLKPRKFCFYSAAEVGERLENNQFLL